MSLVLSNPEQNVQQIVEFIQQTFQRTRKKKAVIAVSGGIDSAVVTTLLVKALGLGNVFPVLLPHHLQPMEDAHMLLKHLQFTLENVQAINIESMVTLMVRSLHLSEKETVRIGNIKARMRMICVFDIAKRLDALVCGTENKSEHYLGYFTRFGDAASDLEPLTGLYKTQVRQIAQELGLPSFVLDKPPSAGLWLGQTDEQEMGFTYEQADQVLVQLIDLKKPLAKIHLSGISVSTVQKVAQQVQTMQFKREVPYRL